MSVFPNQDLDQRVVNEEEDGDFSEDLGLQSNTIKSNKIIKKA